jgi:FMN phosphatase YigB (HAD superfamily)
MTSFNDNYDCILFDLDGTLVESPKKRFLLYNFLALFRRFRKIFGYFKTIPIVTSSISTMLKNDSATGMNNYSLLVATCQKESKTPEEIIRHELNQYYQNDFLAWEKLFTAVPKSQEFIKQAKVRGKKMYIWTNPIWPEFNVKKRLEWAGFDTQDFSGFTHSHNSAACKPNVEYYSNSLKLFSLDPSRCLLIGDSEYKDGPARDVGINTIILSADKAQSWTDLTEKLLLNN